MFPIFIIIIISSSSSNNNISMDINIIGSIRISSSIHASREKSRRIDSLRLPGVGYARFWRIVNHI